MADVICRSCLGRYYETNERFDPGMKARGDMFQLKAQYVEQGWPHFPYDDSVMGDALDCVGCGIPLPDLGGHVLLDGPFVPTLRVDSSDHELVTIVETRRIILVPEMALTTPEV